MTKCFKEAHFHQLCHLHDDEVHTDVTAGGQEVGHIQQEGGGENSQILEGTGQGQIHIIGLQEEDHLDQVLHADCLEDRFHLEENLLLEEGQLHLAGGLFLQEENHHLEIKSLSLLREDIKMKKLSGELVITGIEVHHHHTWLHLHKGEKSLGIDHQ